MTFALKVNYCNVIHITSYMTIPNGEILFEMVYDIVWYIDGLVDYSKIV